MLPTDIEILKTFPVRWSHTSICAPNCPRWLGWSRFNSSMVLFHGWLCGIEPLGIPKSNIFTFCYRKMSTKKRKGRRRYSLVVFEGTASETNEKGSVCNGEGRREVEEEELSSLAPTVMAKWLPCQSHQPLTSTLKLAFGHVGQVFFGGLGKVVSMLAAVAWRSLLNWNKWSSSYETDTSNK